jgi:pentatricopeptide repeat protein
LDVFNDMVMQEALEGDGHDKRVTNQEGSEKTAVAKPDIITYTTLLYIASKSGMPATIRHADNLLKLSGMRPNKLTHLALLRYFSRAGKLSGVRSTISRMRDQGLELGIDGINACMTAFMRTSQMDIASTIYRVLRHHVVPELDIGAHDINAAIRYLDVSEGIIIPENIIPDRISYTTVIQGLAYHGDLIQSMQVFVHMLSSPDIEPHAPRAPDEKGELLPVSYPTTLPVFRAFFLGFARHAQSPLPTRQKQNRLRNFNPPSPDSPWTLKNLDVLFESFLEWPVDTQPSDRTIYWILVAFAKTSGNDADKLQKVWSQLRSRFEGRWGGRLERFRKRVHGELPSVDEWEY